MTASLTLRLDGLMMLILSYNNIRVSHGGLQILLGRFFFNLTPTPTLHVGCTAMLLSVGHLGIHESHIISEV